MSIVVNKDPHHMWFRIDPLQHEPRHATVPQWHFDMILDDQRNSSYCEAVKEAIATKKEIGHDQVAVLDAGAGSGLLSMMAARYTFLYHFVFSLLEQTNNTGTNQIFLLACTGCIKLCI